MPNCIMCGSYFKLSQFNKSNECNDCLPYSEAEDIDNDMFQEIEMLLNKQGRVPAYIYDAETDSI